MAGDEKTRAKALPRMRCGDEVSDGGEAAASMSFTVRGLPFEPSSHGLLALHRSTGEICPALPDQLAKPRHQAGSFHKGSPGTTKIAGSADAFSHMPGDPCFSGCPPRASPVMTALSVGDRRRIVEVGRRCAWVKPP